MEDIWLDLRPFVNSSAMSVHTRFSLHRTYNIFRSLGLRHLVVVDDNYKVAGIIIIIIIIEYKVAGIIIIIIIIEYKVAGIIIIMIIIIINYKVAGIITRKDLMGFAIEEKL